LGGVKWNGQKKKDEIFISSMQGFDTGKWAENPREGRRLWRGKNGPARERGTVRDVKGRAAWSKTNRDFRRKKKGEGMALWKIPRAESLKRKKKPVEGRIETRRTQAPGERR